MIFYFHVQLRAGFEVYGQSVFAGASREGEVLTLQTPHGAVDVPFSAVRYAVRAEEPAPELPKGQIPVKKRVK